MTVSGSAAPPSSTGAGGVMMLSSLLGMGGGVTTLSSSDAQDGLDVAGSASHGAMALSTGPASTVPDAGPSNRQANRRCVIRLPWWLRDSLCNRWYRLWR